MADDHGVVYDALKEAYDDGRAVCLATVIEAHGSIPRHAGSKMLVYEDGSFVGTVGGGAMESSVLQECQTVLASGESKIVSYTLNNLEDGDPGICGGTVKIFIEPVGIPPALLLIGAGHVGYALAELAKWMRYRVLVSDDRPEYCNEEYLPGMDAYIVCKPGELLNHVDIDRNTYIAGVTRGLPVDVHLIPQLLKTDAPYIGLIGSRRRWEITTKALRDEHGVSETDLKRIHAPIGLELEAETPKEIALSIMAEITMIRRGGTGEPMRVQHFEDSVH